MMDFVLPLLGGVLIGLSAAGLLLVLGQIAGISGILGAILRTDTEDRSWRAFFVGGLVLGGLVLGRIHPEWFQTVRQAPPLLLVCAGLLVGFGTRLGNGCTSGHGVCGIGRLSPRSIVATIVFIAAGAFTVFVTRHGAAWTP